MYFRNVVGQTDIKERLINMVRLGNIPHALLFSGPDGCGKLPMAIAFAQYLLCKGEKEEDSCSKCSSCYKMDKLVHPDLHFIFPVINKSKSGLPTLSDSELEAWRSIIQDRCYFNYEEWINGISSEAKQGQIFAKESDVIASKLLLQSTEGGYKIVIIWSAEKMHTSFANSMLKLLEEPPHKTLFILISSTPERILDTIVSRTQRIEFKPLPDSVIAEHLELPPYYIEKENASTIAHISHGSWHKAITQIEIGNNQGEFLDHFMQLMRMAYTKNIRELKILSEKIAATGREWQKQFLHYCGRMIRENFIQNFHHKPIVYLTHEEQKFSEKFSPFINEKNVIGLMELFADAERDIEQNVNSKMVFFDISLKLILCIKQ